jgi:nitroreductase
MAERVPLDYRRPSPEEQLQRADALFQSLRRRRSVRDFSPEPLPDGLIERLIETAGSAPSGANMQPWRFVVVTESALKTRIREAAESEEREFYARRAGPEWLADLAALGTDWRKPFLEVAPVLIVVFQVEWHEDAGGRHKHYYVRESVGLATGLLIAAIHEAGLVTLTHTPSPMGFLAKILRRPDNERPFLLLPVGYPAPGARVPKLDRKPLEQILVRDLGG